MNSMRRLCMIVLLIALSTVSVYALAARPVSSPKGVEGAYQYLAGQVKGIGLIDSYSDSATASYTYDNALAVMAFAAKGDYERASTILSTYKNNLPITLEGGYYDVYDYMTGIG